MFELGDLVILKKLMLAEDKDKECLPAGYTYSNVGAVIAKEGVGDSQKCLVFSCGMMSDFKLHRHDSKHYYGTSRNACYVTCPARELMKVSFSYEFSNFLGGIKEGNTTNSGTQWLAAQIQKEAGALAYESLRIKLRSYIDEDDMGLTIL